MGVPPFSAFGAGFAHYIHPERDFGGKAMDTLHNHDTDRRSLATVLRELSSSLNDVVRSEIHLAKAELKETGSRVARDGIMLGVFGVVAALGIFPLMAFFVIGLGRLLGDN